MNIIISLISLIFISFCQYSNQQFAEFETCKEGVIRIKNEKVYVRNIEENDLNATEILKINTSRQLTESEKSFFSDKGPFDAFPQYKGAVTQEKKLNFTSSCGRKYEWKLETTNDNSFSVSVNISAGKKLFCPDWIILMTSERISVQNFWKNGMHVLNYKKWKSDTEREDVLKDGVRILTFDERFENLYIF